MQSNSLPKTIHSNFCCEPKHPKWWMIIIFFCRSCWLHFGMIRQTLSPNKILYQTFPILNWFYFLSGDDQVCKGLCEKRRLLQVLRHRLHPQHLRDCSQQADPGKAQYLFNLSGDSKYHRNTADIFSYFWWILIHSRGKLDKHYVTFYFWKFDSDVEQEGLIRDKPRRFCRPGDKKDPCIRVGKSDFSLGKEFSGVLFVIARVYILNVEGWSWASPQNFT